MAEYISPPTYIDPDDYSAQAVAYLQSKIVGWTPAEGNLDWWLIQAFAEIAAEIGELASSVQTAIFREYGRLVGIPPLSGSPAQATATIVTLAAGTLVSAGTLVAIDSANGPVPFRTMADGTSALAVGGTYDGLPVVVVDVVAEDNGESANGLTGTAIMVDPLDFVDAVAFTTPAAGGADDETDADFLDRLTGELQLLAPRPILPEDFAVLARRISGVYRALAVDGYDPIAETEDNERMVAVALQDSAGQPVSAGIRTEVEDYLESLREINFIVHAFSPTVTTVDVAFTATAETGFDPADVEASAEAAVTAFLNPAAWGIPSAGSERDWVDEPLVRYLEVASVLNGVEGLRHVTALTIEGASADFTLTGPAPLPTPGTIAGTVS